MFIVRFGCRLLSILPCPVRPNMPRRQQNRLGKKRRVKAEMKNLQKRETHAALKRVGRMQFNSLLAVALRKKKPPRLCTDSAQMRPAIIRSMSPRAEPEWQDQFLQNMADRSTARDHADASVYLRDNFIISTSLTEQPPPLRPFASGPVVVPSEIRASLSKTDRNYKKGQKRKAKKERAKEAAKGR